MKSTSRGRRLRTHRRGRRIGVGLGLEQLEDRRVLAGVTIISHGQNSGTDGWVTGMADALAARVGEPAVTPQYTMVMGCEAYRPDRPGVCREDGVIVQEVSPETRFPTSSWDTTPTGEAVIKIDWSALTPSVLTGYPTTDAVATAVADYLLENTVGGVLVPELPIHLIGHSRGASLITVLARQLGERGIWVDQATTLDPNNAVRILQNSGTVDFQPTSFENVRFADNYWRAGGNGLPSGISVFGAHDLRLDDNALRNAGPGEGYSSSHSNVHLWYHGTIDDQGTIDNGDVDPVAPPGAWYAGTDSDGDARGPRDAVGYHFSRLAAGPRPAAGLAQPTTRNSVTRSGSQWSNLDAALMIGGGTVVEQGTTVPLTYHYQSTAAATIRFGFDNDRNPYNGGQVQILSTLKPATSAGSGFDAGSSATQDLATEMLSVGQYYPYASISNSDHVRYVYAHDVLEIIDAEGRFVVNSTGDASDIDLDDDRCDTGATVAGGPECTLRAALQQAAATANIFPEPDQIHFAIPGAGPHTISPASALPGIVDAVMIDGTTQPGYAGTPLIEIDGTYAGMDVNGLTITAGDSTVQGLAINRFSGSGILLATEAGNTIQANMIGTNPAGNVDLGNGAHGIVMFNSANNLVGGAAANQANVISGNGGHGVFLSQSGSTNNAIRGNLIGVGVDGDTPLGNGGSGVRIDQSARNNLIGSPGNVISSNSASGVSISGASTSGNSVVGNWIGTNIHGLQDRGNGGNGVEIAEAADNSIGMIGGGNVISGNSVGGVLISGPTAGGNVVQANVIGLDITGNAALPNDLIGLTVLDAPNNMLGGVSPGAGNVISGNRQDGIFIFGAHASGNQVAGNFIGTSSAGTAAIGNGQFGIVIREAPNNTVGGVDADAGNVVSGNGEAGVAILNATATGNAIVGNLIGTDATGTSDVGNANTGVLIWKAPGNRVGGLLAAERNVISGNDLFGVRIASFLASGNMVQGNFIGTDVTGAAPLPNSDSGVHLANAQNSTIGGTAIGARNIISANGNHGVVLTGAGVVGNQVLGNFIGVDVSGTVGLGNSRVGVRLGAGARNNTIGGGLAGAGNVISANGTDGVVLADAGTTGNLVAGNRIGTDPTGNFVMGNGNSGISILDADHNTIGGIAAAERNQVSANGLFGIVISGPAATGNQVQGNAIGTDATGTLDLGNASTGVYIAASGNTLGGVASGAGNLISGNDFLGVRIVGTTAAGNEVLGNLIGTQIDGTSPLGNTDHGIWIDNGQHNAIGGTTMGAGNVIAHQSRHGVVVTGNATENAILGNAIFANGGLGIDLNLDGVTMNDRPPGDEDNDVGPNQLQNFPLPTSAVLDGDLIIDYSVPSSVVNSTYDLTVEFFLADASGTEGQRLLGRDTYPAELAMSSKQVRISSGTASVGDRIVATATDAGGNTSEFSTGLVVMAPASGAQAGVDRDIASQPNPSSSPSRQPISAPQTRSIRGHAIGSHEQKVLQSFPAVGHRQAREIAPRTASLDTGPHFHAEFAAVDRLVAERLEALLPGDADWDAMLDEMLDEMLGMSNGQM